MTLTSAAADKRGKFLGRAARVTQAMTVANLLDVLEHLPFGPRVGSCMLQLDRGVRDYLLRALRRR